MRKWMCRDRIGTKQSSNTDTDYRRDSSRPHLLAARTHAGVTNTVARTQRRKRPAPIGRTAHPHVRALALHGVPDDTAGSHLGSTLKPGRAVLTGGVFRRSGSVAYVRADASPSEVLALPIVHPKPAHVNPTRGSSSQMAAAPPADTSDVSPAPTDQSSS